MCVSFKEKESDPKPSALSAELTCGGHFREKDVDGFYLTGVSKLITVSKWTMHVQDKVLLWEKSKNL